MKRGSRRDKRTTATSTSVSELQARAERDLKGLRSLYGWQQTLVDDLEQTLVELLRHTQGESDVPESEEE